MAHTGSGWVVRATSGMLTARNCILVAAAGTPALKAVMKLQGRHLRWLARRTQASVIDVAGATAKARVDGRGHAAIGRATTISETTDVAATASTAVGTAVGTAATTAATTAVATVAATGTASFA